MMQAAESCLRDHTTTMRRTDSACWRFLAQPQVRGVLVVVADVFAEKALQVPLVEHDHMIEQITAAGFHPSLSHSILPRASERSSLGTASHGFDGSNYVETELLVAVEDQLFVRGLERKCFPQLLHDPETARVARDVEMQDAPTIMANEEKTVEDSEGDRVHGKEVHCGNDFAVILDECLPPSDLFGTSRRSLHPTRNRALRNVEAEHLQFSVDAGSSPCGILCNHAKDEFTQFLGDVLSSQGNRMA